MLLIFVVTLLCSSITLGTTIRRAPLSNTLDGAYDVSLIRVTSGVSCNRYTGDTRCTGESYVYSVDTLERLKGASQEPVVVSRESLCIGCLYVAASRLGGEIGGAVFFRVHGDGRYSKIYLEDGLTAGRLPSLFDTRQICKDSGECEVTCSREFVSMSDVRLFVSDGRQPVHAEAPTRNE